MKIAGLDIGTTGCKLTVFSESGEYLGKAYRDYPVYRGSAHEIDAGKILDAVLAVIREMAEKHPDIGGIGVTSFGESFVLAGDGEDPLLPTMLYTDPRGAEEVRELEEKIGSGEIARITGLRAHEMYSLPKLMWVKKHLPDVWKQVKHIFLIEDYVVWLLTGTAQIDYSLATRTQAFDISKLEFSQEILDAAGIPAELFSKPVPTGTSAGPVKPEVAEKTGLGTDTIVVSVSHDQVAAAVGAGAFDASVAVDGAGTVECLTPIFDSLPDPDVMYNGYFSVVPYVIPGTYVAYAFSYTGGALIQWCSETLAGKEAELAKARGISVNEFLEEQYADMQESGRREKDVPTGLLVLPHFAGAATPYMDTGSKGAILGLTMDTTVADLYRACLEGVVYEMMVNAEALKGSGVKFERLNATGGGARSALWMQMKANALNVPITALKTADAGTVGSAMLTGVAAGVFKDLGDAAAHMVEEVKTYYPDAGRNAAFRKVFERYKKIYAAVRPLT